MMHCSRSRHAFISAGFDNMEMIAMSANPERPAAPEGPADSISDQVGVGEDTTSPEPANDNLEEEDYDLGSLFEIPRDVFPIFFPLWACGTAAKAQLYRALRVEVESAIQPQDILEQMDVAEITACFWNMQHIRGSVNHIIKAARVDALAVLLAPVCGHQFDVAVGYANDYFFGDAEQKERVARLMRGCGIGPEAIAAQALAQRAPLLQVLNQTASSLGIRREDILAAVEKRRAARARKPKKRRAA
jgi:hypothetical protein